MSGIAVPPAVVGRGTVVYVSGQHRSDCCESSPQASSVSKETKDQMLRLPG